MKRTVVTIALSLFSLISVLALSSTSSEGVKEGMSTDQVSRILGKPDVVLTAHDNQDIIVWKYTVNTIVSFENGKVESVYKPDRSK